MREKIKQLLDYIPSCCKTEYAKLMPQTRYIPEVTLVIKDRAYETGLNVTLASEHDSSNKRLACQNDRTLTKSRSYGSIVRARLNVTLASEHDVNL